MLDALLELRDQIAHSGEPSRNMVEQVLQRIRDAGEAGAAVAAPAVSKILQDLSQQDEQFLAVLAQRLPRIVQTFPALREDNAEEQVEPVLQDIRSLQEAAHTVRATAVMLFFAGLETFFRIATSRKVTIIPQRFDAVASRLGNIEPLAQEWIEVGRKQRASIEHLL